MTALITRPGDYGFHAESVAVDLPTVAESSGYIAGTIANPDVADALGKQHGRWGQYCDVTALKVEDFLDPNLPALVRGVSLTYAMSAGLANLTPLSTPAAIGGGCRITWDLNVLGIYGLASAAFQPTMRTWVYGTSSTGPGQYPVIRTSVVPLGTAAAPAGSEIVIGGVDTDATDITANLAAALGETITVNADLAFTGPLTTQDIDCQEVACRTLVVSSGAGTLVTVTGDDASTAVSLDGVTQTALDVLTDSASESSCTITNDDAAGTALTCGRANFTGDMTLGGTGNALIVPATPTFQNQVHFQDTINFPGVTATGDTVDVDHILADDINLQAATGYISLGEVRYITDSSPSANLGVVQFDGRSLTQGDSTNALRVAAPLDDYLSTASTGLAYATQLSLSIDLDAAETIVISFSSELSNNAVTPECGFRIQVDAVTQGGQESRFPIATNRYMDANRTVHFTAAGAGIVSITAQIGVGGGGSTTTGKNLQMSVRRI